MPRHLKRLPLDVVDSLVARGARPFGDPSIFSSTMPEMSADDERRLAESLQQRARAQAHENSKWERDPDGSGWVKVR